VSWPEGWTRQDIGDSPGGTDGTQHVWIDKGQIKTYAPADVPVKVIAILLAVVDDQPESAMHPAWLITWTETKRGWGQRFDGSSLHEDNVQGAEYVAAYWVREKAREDDSRDSGGVPDEYCRPDSEGDRVLVSTVLMERIKKGAHGIRLGRHTENQLKADGELKF